ncbi:hemerythrin domain-containing protein [Kineosporia sp. A_224]|uniref:hemerythrin domain-containing protein n=1 Tax=Kineosporia sp. A_224 TaxID=1962180 RepID=UPI000B4AAF29|nr:hemerythrin domain-containing protein [Kineosporia sp. A_224]
MPEHDAHDDVITELVVDHREVEELFARLEGPLSPEDRQDALEHLVAELVRHSVAEEAWIYPAMRDRLDDGNAIADRETAEHHEVELMLKELEGTDPHSPASRPVLEALMTAVRGHVAEEEKQLFPALRAVYSAEELHDLGDKVRTAKKAAPTRPHPGAPRDQVSRRVMGPFVGLVDRTRDALSGRSV